MTINQVKKMKGIDQVVLCTTNRNIDKELLDVASSLGIGSFAGDPERVLDRVYEAAKFFKADEIVYFGGDCPLIDVDIYSEIFKYFSDNELDFITCYEPQTYPGGYDFNIIKTNILKIAYENALAPSQRINMFSYFTFNKINIKKHNYEYESNLSKYHLSLDNPEDFIFLNEFFKIFDGLEIELNLENTLKTIRSNPELNKLANNLKKPISKNALMNSEHIYLQLIDDVVFLLEEYKESPKKIRDKAFGQARNILEIL